MFVVEIEGGDGELATKEYDARSLFEAALMANLDIKDYPDFRISWLRVSGTTEMPQVDERVRHQLHAVVPLLDELESQKQPFEFILPGKGPLDLHSQGIDGFVEQPLAPTLGALAVAGILFDVGDQARIEDRLAIRLGIKPAIEIEIRPFQHQPRALGHPLQSLQAFR